MNPSAPTPVPIHDIVGPVWFWPYPVWVTICAAFALLVILAGFIYLAKRLLKRKSRILTNRERAIAALSALRDKMAGSDPYTFGVEVSNDVRGYIQSEHGLFATRQTSIEFLQSIAEHALFTDNEKAGLGVLLERTDLLKFARAEAGEAEMLDLLETAVRFVRGEVPSSNFKDGKVEA
jgi:hypothetical protein